MQTQPFRTHDVGRVALRAWSDFCRENQLGSPERHSLERCVPKNSRVREGLKGHLRKCAQITGKKPPDKGGVCPKSLHGPLSNVQRRIRS